MFWSEDRIRFDDVAFDGHRVEGIITRLFVYTSMEFMVYYNAIRG